MKRKAVGKIMLATVCLISIVALLGSGKPKSAGESKVERGKFREVPLTWILDLEEKLKNKIMTPSGPAGESITPASKLELSQEELAAAKQLNLKNYVFMGATLSTTEILNKVGMDEVLASIGKPPIEFMGANSISEQIDQINSLASRAHEIDFVIAEAYEAKTTGPAFVELARSGVPQLHNWTTPSGLANEPNYIGLVDADGYGQGAAAAEILAYMMNYKGEVGLIYFALEQWTNVMRLKGAEETFAKYPDIKVVSKKGFTDPNQSRDIALGMLQSNPEIDAIWGTWMEGVATGAAEAVIELGKTGEVIVAAPDLGGIAGARFIADPDYPIVGCGAADCIEMGKNSVNAAIKWKLGKKDEVRNIYTAAKVYPIVRANLVDGFNKQTRGTLGDLPREVLEILEK